MELNLFDIIVQYGWQTAVIAIGALVLIGCFKPLIRKGIAQETARHSIYMLLNFVFVAAITVAVVYFTTWKFDWNLIFNQGVAGYTLLNILYPLYSNLGVKDLLLKIAVGLGKMIGKKFGEPKEPDDKDVPKPTVIK